MEEINNNEIDQIPVIAPSIANIKITNREAALRRRRKILRTTAAIVSAILVSLLIMYYFTYKLVQERVKAELYSKTVEDSFNIVRDLYNRDEWRKAYNNAIPFLAGVSKTEDGFKKNDFREVTSGIVIDKEGHILVPMGRFTEADKNVKINIPADSKEIFYDASLVGADKSSDILVYKCPGINRADIDVADENSLKIADTIILVAAPFGSKDYGNLKTGSLHTKSMLFTFTDDTGSYTKVKAMIGSFPIDISNDGGAAVDIKGQIVGISNLSLTKKLGLENTFAIIPFNELNAIVRRVTNNDGSITNLLGIKGNYVSVKNLGKSGYYVLEVDPNSTASRGGILPTDLILSIDGNNVDPKKDINTYIQHKKVGEIINIKIERRGQEINLVVKIY